MEERLHYWREWLTHGEPPALTWTPHRPPPATPTFHTHVPWQRYAPELTQQLKALSQRHGVTLYMTLITAYAMILQRYTGCADLTIGTTYSNRPHWQFASLIGATIDVPALRIDMTDNPDLATLLARVRAVVTAALTYQDVPWERIAPSLQLASTPLFRVVFTFFAETPHGQLQLPGITVTFLEELINELSRPALYLVLWENQTVAGDALTGYWMHKQDVFSAETAEQMNEEFRALLTALVNHPTQTVRELLATY
jgi:non-ribosomal peptide synthetase component F